MAGYHFVVLSNPASPEVEDEYNDWYDNVHLRDVVDIPGFVSAQRFEWTARRADDVAPDHKYLAIYEIDTDDLAETFNELMERAFTPQMPVSSALGSDTWSNVYRVRGPKATAAR
jgi:hypothetical protein